jgi:transcriptional antiterminator NusG
MTMTEEFADDDATPADAAVEELVEEIAEDIAEDLEEIVTEVEAIQVAESIAESVAVEALEEVADEAAESDAEVLTFDDEFVEEVTPPAAISPFERPGDWYVIHSYAGYENKVRQNLESRIRSMNMEDRIFEVVIPMEDVIEFKNGRKVVVQKKVFPGYVLVRVNLNDDSWYVVRNTPGVTGFVGNGAKPTPLSRKEVENILGTGEVEMTGTAASEKKARPRLEFDVSEQVRVVAGPFADFNGAISEIDFERSRLKVLVNIFGRETPVELEFGQVAKL